jgi:hypothetical protein
MTINKKRTTNPAEDVREKVGLQITTGNLEISVVVPQKTKSRIPYDKFISLLGMMCTQRI